MALYHAALCLLLAGCETLPLFVFGSPPIGLGKSGRVVDAHTGLPIGGATVFADLAPPVTSDNEGRFHLPVGFQGAVSAFRAGYAGLTLEAGQLLEQDLALVPLAPLDGASPSRQVVLSGQVLPAGVGEVQFTGGNGGQTITGFDGRFQLQVGVTGGTIASGILAGGRVQGGPLSDPQAPFSFATFGFRALHLGDQPQVHTLATSPAQGTVGVQYGGTLLEVTTTQVSLDFGLLGEVPVFRGQGEVLQANVPVAQGVPLRVRGVTKSADGRLRSIVETVVEPNSDTQLAFLTPPQPLSPRDGSSNMLIAAPQFKWSAVPGARLYEVVLTAESNGVQPVWRGVTTGTSLGFPLIPANVNNASLRYGLTYVWQVTAYESASLDQVLADVASTQSQRYSMSTKQSFRL